VKLPRVVPAARTELREATQRYLEDNPAVAADFVERVESAFRSIARSPRRFPRIETIRTEREIRRVLLSRFPYIVVYEILNEESCVLAVAHAHRRPDYWLQRKEE
jgi:plasmid stabilization system protein ParE